MKKKEKEKNKEQLTNKLMKLHQRITELEKSGTNKKLQDFLRDNGRPYT